VRFTTAVQLEQATSSLRATDLVISGCGTYSSQSATHRVLLSALRRSRARLATFSAGHLPAVGAGAAIAAMTGIAGRMRMAALTVAHAGYRSRPLRRIRQGWLHTRYGIRSLDIVWVATTIRDIHPALIDAHTQIRYVHAFDYDFLLTVDEDSIGQRSRIVLVDSMGPLHPDYVTASQSDRRPSIPEYFATITRFLETVEQRTGSAVTIAAHPRATPGSLEDFYGNREVVYGSTAQCIAESRLVLLPNSSTATNFAVVLRRPCLFITSRFFDPRVLPAVEVMSRLLHVDVVDADDPAATWAWPVIDDQAYAAYEEAYIKRAGSPRAPFWRIAAQDVVAGVDRRVP